MLMRQGDGVWLGLLDLLVIASVAPGGPVAWIKGRMEWGALWQRVLAGNANVYHILFQRCQAWGKPNGPGD